MECQGRLHRLKRVKGYSGSIRPAFAGYWTKPSKQDKFPSICDKTKQYTGEFTGEGCYTLDSAVFLSMGADLIGTTVTIATSVVEVVRASC